jgi:hypothetical protein
LNSSYFSYDGRLNPDEFSYKKGLQFC